MLGKQVRKKKQKSKECNLLTLAQQYMVKRAKSTGTIPISFQRATWTTNTRMLVMKRRTNATTWKTSQCIRNHLSSMVTIRK